MGGRGVDGNSDCPGSARVSRVGDSESFRESRTFPKACFSETPKPTREMRALPGQVSLSLTQMPLLADCVSFSEPTCDFIVDFIHAFEPKGVEMISR